MASYHIFLIFLRAQRVGRPKKRPRHVRAGAEQEPGFYLAFYIPSYLAFYLVLYIDF